MSVSSTERAFEIVSKLDECRHLDEVASTLVSELNDFGVEMLIGGVHRENGKNASPLKRTVLFNTYPPEWIEHYNGREYVADDPVVRRANEGTGLQGWSWGEEGLYRKDEVAARVMNEARDFKLASGFSVSTVLPTGEGVVMSFAGTNALELSPEGRDIMLRVGAHTLHRGFLMAKQREEIGLTARQIQYLQLASEGLRVR